MLQNITTVSQILNKYLLATRKNILQVLSSSPVRFHSATPRGSLFFSFQAVYHLRFCHSRATILPFFCCRESFCCLEQSIFPQAAIGTWMLPPHLVACLLPILFFSHLLGCVGNRKRMWKQMYNGFRGMGQARRGGIVLLRAHGQLGDQRQGEEEGPQGGQEWVNVAFLVTHLWWDVEESASPPRM